MEQGEIRADVMALDEARAILEETEPESPLWCVEPIQFSRPMAHRFEPINGCVECAAGFALADALRAFVEEN